MRGSPQNGMLDIVPAFSIIVPQCFSTIHSVRPYPGALVPVQVATLFVVLPATPHVFLYY